MLQKKRTADIVVGSVVAVCVGIFGWKTYTEQQARSGSKLALKQLGEYHNHFVESWGNYQAGRSYTMLTSTLAHGSIFHLSANMLCLWSFGRPLIMMYSVPTFGIIWVGSALLGGAAQLYSTRFNRAHPGAVGASGSNCGIIGVLTCAAPVGLFLLWAV